MPTGVATIQAVVMRGKVYIEGDNFHMILEYTIEGGQWRVIETPVTNFGMVVVNNQLLIIGGMEREGTPSNQVWALNTENGTWSEPFPAMTITRSWVSAVSYKRWVLVVGDQALTLTNFVEVLDTVIGKWYVATPLPSGKFRASITAIHETLYILWRCSGARISIPVLISDAVSQHPTTIPQSEWQPLPDAPATLLLSIVSHEESLVALEDTSSISALEDYATSIFMYLPQMEKWLKVAELPSPRNFCACVVLPETQQLMVIGGLNERGGFVKSMICTASLCN